VQEVVLPGVPLAWKAPYISSRGAWSVRTPILNQLKDVVRNSYKGPFYTEAFAMDAIFYMPIPKSFSKKKKALALAGSLRPATTPDVDNCRKFASDVVQGIVMSNDSIVVDGRSCKFYDVEPRTVIRLYTIEEYEKLLVRIK